MRLSILKGQPQGLPVHLQKKYGLPQMMRLSILKGQPQGLPVHLQKNTGCPYI
jgi:hypothetical protein